MTRISKWCLALTVVITISGTFMSVAKSQGVTLQTPKNESGAEQGCGSWLEARAERVRLGGRLLLNESELKAWVLGFLSGVALQKSLNNRLDLMGGTETAGLLTWLDNHCRSNPLDNLVQAVMTLVDHLESRRR